MGNRSSSFQKVFYFNSLPIKIYLIISYIRYIIQPILIVMTKGELSHIRMSVPSKADYRIAVLIQVVELIIAFVNNN